MYAIIFFETFFGYLAEFFFIPTACLIPAIIIYYFYGRVKKDYTKVKKYIKRWSISLIPLIICIIIANLLNYIFYTSIY